MNNKSFESGRSEVRIEFRFEVSRQNYYFSIFHLDYLNFCTKISLFLFFYLFEFSRQTCFEWNRRGSSEALTPWPLRLLEAIQKGFKSHRREEFSTVQNSDLHGLRGRSRLFFENSAFDTFERFRLIQFSFLSYCAAFQLWTPTYFSNEGIHEPWMF